MPLQIPSVSEITDLIKKGLTIEAQEKIMALRVATMTLQEENLALRTELQELKKRDELEDLLKFNGFYYTIDQGNKAGKYCPTCYDKDKKLIRLKRIGDGDNGFSELCNVCGHVFNYV